LGTHGLHLLLTGSLDNGDILEGVIEAEGLGPVELDYPKENSRLELGADRASFRVAFKKIQGRASFQHSSVMAGAARNHTPLADTPFTAGELSAPPGFIELVTLPQKPAAYLWYVPDAKKIATEDLSEEDRESLRALGYIE